MGGLQFELQMSWQPGLLSQRRKAGGPLGLKNLGNSCYLNSVLQCLTYTPPLANFCLLSQHSSLCDSVANGVKKRECPFCILERRIARSLSSDFALDAPSKIQSCLRIFADHFRAGFQEDAHEFLRYVIDACHNSCLRLIKLRRMGGSSDEGSTVVKKIFGGALQSQVKCLSCNSDSNKVDEIMDISLDVMYSNSVKEAMHKFFQPEVLDGNNKYKCERCKKLVAARKQMSVLQAPNILVIQLKRFEGLTGKIDKSIAFQEVLSLSSFMAKSSKDPQPEYKLFGTIVHSGYSPESGHYYAYIKDSLGQWYCCNDSYVSLANMNEVLSEKVYILFFCRSNQKSSSVSNEVKPCTSKSGHGLNGEISSVFPDKLSRKPQHSNGSPKQSLNGFKNINFKIGESASSVGVTSSSETTGRSKILSSKATDMACLEKRKRDESSSEISNGFSESDKADGIVYTENKDVPKNSEISPKGNSLASKFSEFNGVARVPHQNGKSVHPLAVNSKRKTPDDPCILNAKDAQSREKIEELKSSLEQEALSILRTCSWSEDVYNFMNSRKRLCAENPTQKLDHVAMKKLLIEEAKSNFMSQVPESLKQLLVDRLRSFIKELN